MIITDAKDRQRILKEINPTRIAVAFLGRDWKRYINQENLKEIVLWPCVGTNPWAVEEIAKIIKFENIYFLDGLHSKIYIGEQSAMLGSCNLSQNGFSEKGHQEAAVFINTAEQIEQLIKTYNQYKESAKNCYPTIESKKNQIKKLKLDVEQSQRVNLTSAPNINTFEADNLRSNIHIDWFSLDGESTVRLDEKKIRKNSDIPISVDIEKEYFSDYYYYHNEDNIRPGDWVLLYKYKNPKQPVPFGTMKWLYVHEIHENVVSGNEPFQKLAGQVKGEVIPIPPFKLDALLKEIIRETIVKKFPTLLPPVSNKESWRLKDGDEKVSEFLKSIKKIYEKL